MKKIYLSFFLMIVSHFSFANDYNREMRNYAYHGQMEELESLFAQHFDEIDIDSRSSEQYESKTALMHAAAQGNSDIVRLLLGYDADPSLKSTTGKTAEEYAINKKPFERTLFSPEQLETNLFTTFDASLFPEFSGLQRISDELFRSREAHGSDVKGDIHHKDGAKYWHLHLVASGGKIQKLENLSLAEELDRPIEGDISPVIDIVDRFFQLLPEP